MTYDDEANEVENPPVTSLALGLPIDAHAIDSAIHYLHPALSSHHLEESKH